ncbi:MAG: metallophosphoesterase [Bacteroidetes bacterium]|nr:metallophosphoesterase [Bacteroidota bacterium]
MTSNTQYYYKCINGSDESDIFSFRTPPEINTPGAHLRFLIFGDNQTDYTTSTYIAKHAKLKMQELFGEDIQNHINLILHVGDIVGDGSNVNLYEQEYFRPFSCLTANIPSMVTIGNHEGDNAYYYKYMKYEELIGAPLAISERYYSFNLLNSKFIAINPNAAYQNMSQLIFIQTQLVQSDLEPNTGFVFLYGHMPGHSEIWPDGNTAWVQEQVVSMMSNHTKSTLYVCGHTHAYEHAIGESAVDSAGYNLLINGGGGGALDRWGMYANQTDYPETYKSLDHYCFNLIDIDVDAKSYVGYTYSFGNPDKPLACELVDVFHRSLNQSRPVKPMVLGPVGDILATSGPVVLEAAAFSGADSLMSSQFQLTAIPGDYSAPVFESKRNKEDWYGDSGAPDYLPNNLNQGINLQAVTVTSALNIDHVYAWRIRYRDYNLKWSEWSDEAFFTLVPGQVISGNVIYDNILQSHLNQVVVKLFKNNAEISQTLTNINGSFSFPPVLPGQYAVRCSHNGLWGGVNSIDALLVLRHFVGLTHLEGVHKLAADPDGNSYINAADALYVSKRFTGLISSFPAGDWMFESPPVTLSGTNIFLTIKGLCTGDVNGSYTP